MNGSVNHTDGLRIIRMIVVVRYRPDSNRSAHTRDVKNIATKLAKTTRYLSASHPGDVVDSSGSTSSASALPQNESRSTPLATIGAHDAQGAARRGKTEMYLILSGPAPYP